MSQKVIHSQFGIGSIISQDENNVIIDFNGVQKTMITKYAKLTNEDGTPFGVHAVASVKKSKKSNTQRHMEWMRSLSDKERRDLKFENEDGSFNHNEYNKFLEHREEVIRASHSTFY